MKIAVPIKENLQIDNHFGHCSFYQIFTINENNEIFYVETTDAPAGCGCKSDMAGILQKKGVTVMLAGGIGNGAINKLAEHGITVIRNCEGGSTENIQHYLAGELMDGGHTCDSHEEGHVCNHDH